jgi:hypothetical protein
VAAVIASESIFFPLNIEFPFFLLVSNKPKACRYLFIF